MGNPGERGGTLTWPKGRRGGILKRKMPFVSASSVLITAAEELRFLLGRGYPREKSLEMVGNRHTLVFRERELLRRAVLGPDSAARRRDRLAVLKDLKGERVGIDGHNVLITLESALSGKDLVRGDDGVIRDIARASSSYRPSDLTRRALGLILQALIEYRGKEAVFFLDSPLSRSGELAGQIREEMAKAGVSGTARAVPVPEKELKPFKGLTASSDGELIDDCARPLDLAGEIITKRIKEVRVIEFIS